jgi:hypothetical protein
MYMADNESNRCVLNAQPQVPNISEEGIPSPSLLAIQDSKLQFNNVASYLKLYSHSGIVCSFGMSTSGIYMYIQNAQ